MRRQLVQNDLVQPAVTNEIIKKRCLAFFCSRGTTTEARAERSRTACSYQQDYIRVLSGFLLLFQPKVCAALSGTACSQILHKSTVWLLFPPQTIS